LNYCKENGHALFYWREGNDEVDFVLERRGQVVGIEVKSGVIRTENAGMKAFQRQFAPDKMLLIGGEGLSWQQFLGMDIDQIF
jgi:predicted AAA+ superfamily ATPase